MNENPEGTPNPLNPAPGTGDEMAAGTGLDFVETAPEPETADAPETPEVPEVPEAPEVQEVIETQEASVDAEPVNIASFATATKAEPKDPMMRPVSHSNFDTLAMEETAIAVDTPEEKVEDSTFAAVESTPTPFRTSAPISETPELVAKDSIVEPANKNGKKKAFAIGAIVFLMIAIICGAAAVAIMMLSNNNSGDRVSKAIEKLINGQVSNIVTVQGNINSLSDAEDSSFSSLNIDFNGSFDTASGINSVSAKISSEISDTNKISIGVDEVRNDSGDTFFKIRGLDTLMNNTADVDATVNLSADSDMTINLTDCINGSAGTDNCASPSSPAEPSEISELVSLYSGLFSVINDQWILASGDFVNNMDDLGIFENSSTCLINAFGTLPKYSKDIASKYEENQFITYSTEKLEISKKKNDLYKLSVDSDKLTAFINSLSNNGFINEINACAGNTATNSDVASEMIRTIFADLPVIYVEIDDNYNFTRVYFKALTGDEDNTVITTADLSIDYPPKIEVETPEEYIDMTALVNNLLTNMLSGVTE